MRGIFIAAFLLIEVATQVLGKDSTEKHAVMSSIIYDRIGLTVESPVEYNRTVRL